MTYTQQHNNDTINNHYYIRSSENSLTLHRNQMELFVTTYGAAWDSNFGTVKPLVILGGEDQVAVIERLPY